MIQISPSNQSYFEYQFSTSWHEWEEWKSNAWWMQAKRKHICLHWSMQAKQRGCSWRKTNCGFQLRVCLVKPNLIALGYKNSANIFRLSIWSATETLEDWSLGLETSDLYPQSVPNGKLFPNSENSNLGNPQRKKSRIWTKQEVKWEGVLGKWIQGSKWKLVKASGLWQGTNVKNKQKLFQMPIISPSRNEECWTACITGLINKFPSTLSHGKYIFVCLRIQVDFYSKKQKMVFQNINMNDLARKASSCVPWTALQAYVTARKYGISQQNI